MKHHVLIVDPEKHFAEMLCQSLAETEDLQAAAVASGKEAVKAAATTDYDLVIVDMGLTDVEGSVLIQKLHEDHPSLPIVIIPLEGDEVPSDLVNAGVVGTLPKPFFLPELPDRIRSVVGPAPETSDDAPPPAAQAATPAKTPVHVAAGSFAETLTQLAQETGSQAVILTKARELITYVSNLPESERSSLAALVYESWQSSTRVAEILGKEQIRFEQSIEGGQYLLYSLAISNALILSVVVEGNVPLGMIRHRAKETAEEIRSQL